MQKLPAAATAVDGLTFISDFWVNLHHTLYAAAWAERPEAGTPRALAGTWLEPLHASLTVGERAVWRAAIGYYDEHLASRHLLFDPRMRSIGNALADGDLAGRGIGRAHRRVLESAAPVYLEQFWPRHHEANRGWITDAADRIRTLAPDVVPRLEQAYGTPWPTDPVRVDVVRVGSREGAYTTLGPAHVTIASGDPDFQGRAAAEIAFHETSHLMIDDLSRTLDRALGKRRSDHPQLWHVVLFYVTGMIVREEWGSRDVAYSPYLYATGLIDRVWSRYRHPVEQAWQPYIEGRITRDEAIAATVAALPRATAP